MSTDIDIIDMPPHHTRPECHHGDGDDGVSDVIDLNERLKECLDEPSSLATEQTIPLSHFLNEFGEGLLDRVREQNPAVYTGQAKPHWDGIFTKLLRKPFDAQANAVKAVSELLLNQGEPAAILNAEMGTGKTIMGIMAACVMHDAGYQRTLIVSPPHLVYKWRREIMQTVPNAKVWILNGADSLRKLLSLRGMMRKPEHPEFFVLGRVRMRMGFNWAPSYATRTMLVGAPPYTQKWKLAACPDCGALLKDADGHDLQAHLAKLELEKRRRHCEVCKARLWTLTRADSGEKSKHAKVLDALRQLPTIGTKTAERLISAFGDNRLAGMLEDNFHNFVNLMDEDGDLIFSDSQAKRMERFLGNHEISFGQGGYQPTEFIKRYLPKGYFGFLVVDEGHEYKNEGSAQGQAFAVLASQCSKLLLLTGTLMGGYADDLFYLLYRINPGLMEADGFGHTARGSLGPAAMAFLRSHGVLIDTYTEQVARSHRTAKANAVVRNTKQGAGFGPKGIMRYVVPITVFLKLKDIGGNVLPPYVEEFMSVELADDADHPQRAYYQSLERDLKEACRKALLGGDKTLLGVMLGCLLAWPDTSFRDEYVYHPRKRVLLGSAPSLFDDTQLMPKEQKLLALCRSERLAGRRVLVYTSYTGKRDTTARLKAHLERSGFKAAVLKATVSADLREDWVADQVDRGIDVLITNPELVKTGLDLLEFPTIVFMQTGYNVYTLMQASRRSWRIGQKLAVRVIFMGYMGTAQQLCLQLMSKKIAVAQSTSGDMPEGGLDSLNPDGDSIEVELAKRLVGELG
jgi:SNF2 family DNA or RNA helicase